MCIYKGQEDYTECAFIVEIVGVAVSRLLNDNVFTIHGTDAIWKVPAFFKFFRNLCPLLFNSWTWSLERKRNFRHKWTVFIFQDQSDLESIDGNEAFLEKTKRKIMKLITMPLPDLLQNDLLGKGKK